jgi:flagellar basal-body rod protein FlgF
MFPWPKACSSGRMDNAIYVGLSRQMILQRELDIVANNLANVDTVGFKLESMITNPDPLPLASPSGLPTTVTFAMQGGVERDFTQGPLIQTNAALDVAIQGRGFFEISTASGPRYTRDGRFRLDPTGRLVTQDGDPVQNGGADITLNPLLGPIGISSSGVISQAGQIVGQLPVVDFASLSALSKDGNNLFRNDSNLAPQAATDATLSQGMIETSNVEPVKEITKLIQINRAYDAISNMMASNATLSQTAIQRLGAVTVS